MNPPLAQEVMNVVSTLDAVDGLQERPEAVVTAPLLSPDDLSALHHDSPIAVAIVSDGRGLLRVEVGALEPVPLRRMMPALQSMDLEVLHEHAGTWRGENGCDRYVYDFLLEAGPHAHPGLTDDVTVYTRIRDTFLAIWNGLAEADNFNALVPATSLTWRQVAMLRSYARFCRQLPLPYSQTRIEQVFLDTPTAGAAIVELFDARFGNPTMSADDPARAASVAAADAAVSRYVDAAVHIDADRILRIYRDLINATVRTNAFSPKALTSDAPYLVHKLRADAVTEVPEPRPYSEIIVYSPDFEGLHLRFGAIARGGLRWSDRLDDYRTEVLGLARAQTVKNAMIVPAGAKGVFVVRHATQLADDARLDYGKRCYRHFVSALLDVVDTHLRIGDDVTAPPMVCHDADDSYLVVAADKGTATFSDIANEVSLRRGYWMGDAFASGGSSGYDHKAMGITARGAWVSGDSHLRELGIDPHVEPFTAIGIGDMSGDVFGNGMLLRPHVRLLAAFDHRHIFIDPTPHETAACRERQRLYALGRSCWNDYDRTLISAGGGVWPRTAKSIPVSDEMVHALGLQPTITRATPAELISHILRAPVDLLWNGGVGTYIKSPEEQHSDVGDKVNDTVRVDADQVRARSIVEGGNLGVSQRGRIAYARRGGLINTDAIDNAAGVDCSDHEVNIKTYLASAGLDDDVDRDDLLAAMTDNVAQHVLSNNLTHNRLLSDARSNAAQMLTVHRRMIEDLQRRRGLGRELETLPSETEFARLETNGQGLSSPELATLLGHVKLDLKADLETDAALDEPDFAFLLTDYFPTPARQCARASVTTHPLARDIITTSLVNTLVGTSGLTYAYRLAEETGATTGDIARAHAIVSEVFGLTGLWDDIHNAELPTETTNALIIEGRRLLDRASRWFLLHRPQPLDVAAEVRRFRAPMATLRTQLSVLMGETEAARMEALRRRFAETGAPASAALALGDALYAYSLLDVIETAEAHVLDEFRVAQVYFVLSERLGVDTLLVAVSGLPRTEHWNSLARLQLREDLYHALRELAVMVVRTVPPDTGSAARTVEAFERSNSSAFERAHRILTRLPHTSKPLELAHLSVAAAQLRGLHAAQC